MILTNTLTGNEMRAINRSAILEFIRRKGPTSRSIIARELHVTLPTVMRIVDELIENGLVISTGIKEYTGGRRRPLLDFNSSGNVIIGIDLGGTTIYGAVTDLSGAVLAEKMVENTPVSSEESYHRLTSLIKILTKSKEISRRKILGLGIGTQGITKHLEGVVSWDPIQDWKDFPLKQKLVDSFKLPVVIDNDVNLAALGEHWFGIGQNTENMVFITVGTGIGAGIIIDGSLYRSRNYLAGEVGYILPGKEYLGCQSTDFGVMEIEASLSAITNKALRWAREGKISVAFDELTPGEIFKAMLEKQDWACKLIDEMIDNLSIIIANVCALLDPDLVVLRSGLDNYTDMLVEPILKRIEGIVPMKPKLVTSKLGYRATVLGAIVEVLHDTNSFYLIRKLI